MDNDAINDEPRILPYQNPLKRAKSSPTENGAHQSEGAVAVADTVEEAPAEETPRGSARRKPRPAGASTVALTPEQKELADALSQDDLLTSFIGLSEVHSSKYFGCWVDVPLPAYKGMRVLFRTSNEVQVRFQKPEHRRPVAWHQVNRKLADLTHRVENTTLTVEEIEEATEELRSLGDQARKILADYYDNFHHAQTEWLAMYVLDFSPWPFDDVEKPDPERPETYFSLWTDFGDLYVWLLKPGYDAALKASAKNS